MDLAALHSNRRFSGRKSIYRVLVRGREDARSSISSTSPDGTSTKQKIDCACWSSARAPGFDQTRTERAVVATLATAGARHRPCRCRSWTPSPPARRAKRPPVVAPRRAGTVDRHGATPIYGVYPLTARQRHR